MTLWHCGVVLCLQAGGPLLQAAPVPVRRPAAARLARRQPSPCREPFAQQPLDPCAGAAIRLQVNQQWYCYTLAAAAGLGRPDAPCLDPPPAVLPPPYWQPTALHGGPGILGRNLVVQVRPFQCHDGRHTRSGSFR
jgi:hypothetical protein